MSERDLVFEIGTEELPSLVVDLWTGRKGGDEAYPVVVERRLRDEARLDFDQIVMAGTPRRLLLSLRGVPEHQHPVTREVRGPAAAQAFDDAGRPTKAAQGFAASQGLAVERLERRQLDQGEYVFAVVTEEGVATAEALSSVLPDIVRSFPTPKAMRWGEGELRFPRPIRWMLCLFGSELIDFELDGVRTGRTTRGHRFLAPGPYEIKDAGSYGPTLAGANVIVDQSERESLCRREIESSARAEDLTPVIHDQVLGEVKNLVEWPHAAVGSFNPDFLSLPREVLETSMESHQRYFPLEDRQGKLHAGFAVVHNGNPDAVETIVTGHQRVLSARLADAHFFYHADRRYSLESFASRLAGVTYHRKLGTLAQKVERIAALAAAAADHTAASAEVAKRTQLAARLCKADLLTDMVTEFPDLQGVMGREYARKEGLAAEVAEAIYEHYLPRSRSDLTLPETEEGTLLSLADKLDGVVSFLGVGIAPSGSQDPYALRRQAAGVVRLITDRGLAVDLDALVDRDFAALKEQGVPYAEDAEGLPKHRRDVAELLFEQLRRDLLAREVRYDVIDAVLSPHLHSEDPLSADLRSVRARALFLGGQLDNPALEDVTVTYIRCRNLSKGVKEHSVRDDLLTDEAEKALVAVLVAFEPAYLGAVASGDLAEALRLFSGLRPPVDRFFDEVLVMAPEEELKNNRLAILAGIVARGDELADFSKIVDVAR